MRHGTTSSSRAALGLAGAAESVSTASLSTSSTTLPWSHHLSIGGTHNSSCLRGFLHACTGMRRALWLQVPTVCSGGRYFDDTSRVSWKSCALANALSVSCRAKSSSQRPSARTFDNNSNITRHQNQQLHQQRQSERRNDMSSQRSDPSDRYESNNSRDGESKNSGQSKSNGRHDNSNRRQQLNKSNRRNFSSQRLPQHRHHHQRQGAAGMLHSSSEDTARLRKLLQSHATFKKNFITLQSSSQVYRTFCQVCLDALKDAGVVERVACAAVAANEDNNDRRKAQLSIECDLALTGDHPNDALEPVTASTSSTKRSAFTLILPVEALDYLNTPISLPDIPRDVLVSAMGGGASCVEVVEEGGATAQSGSSMSVAEAWAQACDTSSNSGISTSVSAFPDLQLRQLFGFIGDGTVFAPTSGDELAEVLALLQTVMYFKWHKDTLHIRQQCQGGRSQSVTEDERTLADHVAAVSAEAQGLLNTYSSEQNKGTSLAAIATTRLGHTRSLIKHAHAFLHLVPKVDGLITDNAFSLPSPDEVATKGSAECQLLYRVHVLDIFSGLLIRYLLQHWTLMLPPYRGSWFRLMAQSAFFARDLTTPLACWATYAELTDSLPTDGKSGSGVALAQGSLASSRMLDHVQFLRTLCWPTVQDVRSAIVQRALGITTETEPSSSTAAGTVAKPVSKYVSIVNAGIAGNMATSSTFTTQQLKELINVLQSTQHKQRMAYELLYGFFYALRTRNGETVHHHRHYHQRQHCVGKGQRTAELRTLCTLCVYVVDIDHFISERFYARLLRQHKWLLLMPPTKAEAPIASDAVEKLRESVATKSSLEKDLQRQFTEPYALTRSIFNAMGTSELAALWPASGTKRARLLWEAWVRAVAVPCTHLIISDTAALENDTRDRSLPVPPLAAWEALEPIMTLLAHSASLRHVVQQHILLDLVRLRERLQRQQQQQQQSPPTLLSSAAQDGQSNSESMEEQSAVTGQLLQLAHLAAFVIQSDSVTLAVEASEGVSSTLHGSAFFSSVQQYLRECIFVLMTAWTATDTPYTHAEALLRSWPGATAGLQKKEAEKSGNTNTTRVEETFQRIGGAPTFDQSIQRHTSILAELLPHELYTELNISITRRCCAQQSHASISASVSDPLLREWYAKVLDDDAGVGPVDLLIYNVYRQLWDLMDRRLQQRGTSTHDMEAAEETLLRKENLTKSSQQLTRCVFTCEELSIIFSTLCRVHARQGMLTLQSGTKPFFSMLEHVVANNQSEAIADSAASSSSQSDNAAVMRESVRTMKQVLVDEARAHLSELSAHALMNALFLDIISLPDVAVAAEKHIKPLEHDPLQSHSEQQRSCKVDWLSDFEAAAQHSAHTRMVTGLLLYKHFSFFIPDDGGWKSRVWKRSSFGADASDVDVLTTAPEGGGGGGSGGDGDSGAMQSARDVAILSLTLRRLLTSLTYAELFVTRNNICALQGKQQKKQALHDTHTTSPFSPSEGIIVAESQSASGGNRALEQARCLARTMCLAMYASLAYSNDKSPNGLDRARQSPLQLEAFMRENTPASAEQTPETDATTAECKRHDTDKSKGIGGSDGLDCSSSRLTLLPLRSVYAALLYATAEAACYRHLGSCDQLLLWLVGVMTTVPAEWRDMNAQHLLAASAPPRTMSDNTSSPSSGAIASKAARAAVYSRPPTDSLLLAVTSFSLPSFCSHDGSMAAEGYTDSFSAMNESLSQWTVYALSRLRSYVEADLRQNATRSSMSLRSAVASITAISTLPRLGAPPAYLYSFPMSECLAYHSNDRRGGPRNLSLLLAALACFPAAAAGPTGITLAHQLCYARDVLSLEEMTRIFNTLSRIGPALQHGNDATVHQNMERVQEREYILRGLSGGPSSGSVPRRQRASPLQPGASSTYGGEQEALRQTSTIFTNYPALPSVRFASPALRHLWSTLSKRLVDVEAETVPTSVLVSAVQCGSRLDCVDTTIFSRLLACLLMMPVNASVAFGDCGESAAVPEAEGEGLRELSLQQWAVVLEACGCSVEQRRDLAEVLRDGVLDVLHRQQDDQMVSEGGLQDARIAEEVVASQCFFIESLAAIFVESEAFWVTVKRVVEIWAARHHTTTGAERAASHVVHDSASAPQRWERELQLSFNYAVRTAGHHRLCFNIIGEDEERGGLNAADACSSEDGNGLEEAYAKWGWTRI